MSYVDSGEDKVTVDFSISLSRASGGGFVEMLMSVDGDEPELITIVSELAIGETKSFVFSREFAPGHYEIEFIVGDAREVVDVNVQPAAVALLLLTATPTVTPTPTATLTPTPAPTATPTLEPTKTVTPTPEATTFPLYDLNKLRKSSNASPTAVVTAAPTATFTPRPTPEPTVTLPSLSQFQNGRWLAGNRPSLYNSIRSIGWVRDGIDDSEVETIKQVLVTAAYYEGIAKSLLSLDWFDDHIDEAEFTALDYLDGVADYSEVAAGQIVAMDWFADGITESDAQVVRYLFGIAYEDDSAVERIVAMPFLSTVEPADVSAVDSLETMVAFRKDEFDRVMAHPVIVDGITDDLAPIVAMLNGTAKYNPNLISTLLSPNAVIMERRNVELPLSGKVDMAIVRTAPGAMRSMDLLEHAVRTSEELMDEPLTTNYIGLLFENAAFVSFAGTNFGTHMAILPKYDMDDDSHWADFAGYIIAHEVAHYYWSGHADWIDEGAADLMELAIENRRVGSRIEVNDYPCGHMRSISELEELAPVRGSNAFDCNYSLGQRLFVDMFRTLGADAFWTGFRNLYQKSLAHSGDKRHTPLTIDHVREAFGTYAGASDVIGRWYDGSVEYNLSSLDTSATYPKLLAINGRVDDAYVMIGEKGAPESTFSLADLVERLRFKLHYSYEHTGTPREIMLEVVEFYEDGFEIDRSAIEFTAGSGRTVGWSSITIGSNTPAVGKYWIYVYHGDRKVAEVQYEVTP